MKRAHVVLGSIALLAWAIPATAVDYQQIERTLAGEPAYRSKVPGYCLLVFGPNARMRVWLVLDDDGLYLVERHVQGDTRESERRVLGKDRRTDSEPGVERRFKDFECGTVPVAAGMQGYVLSVTVRQNEKGQPGISRISGKQKEFELLSEGWISFAGRPQDAPIIHFDGPWTFGMMDWGGKTQTLSRKVAERDNPANYALSVFVGTPVFGQESAFLRVDMVRRLNMPTPVAEVEFPGKAPGDQPIKTQIALFV
jgi:hypothetical protein